MQVEIITSTVSMAMVTRGELDPDCINQIGGRGESLCGDKHVLRVWESHNYVFILIVPLWKPMNMLFP